MSAGDRDDDPRPEADDEPISPEELEDGALEGTVDPMVAMLLAATAPSELDDDVHERILARALGATLDEAAEPPASPAEERAAASLRDAFTLVAERRVVEHALARLAVALQNAYAPRALPELRNEALVKSALSSGVANRRAVFGTVVGVLALAAAFAAFWLRSPKTAPVQHDPRPQAQLESPPALREAPAYVPGMVERRSTASMFQKEDFPRSGGTTQRIDRINEARQADLRKNQFLSWGIGEP
ncbi:MAG: hypothetical protein U0271_26275 [Polyangiaceae bacterium]